MWPGSKAAITIGRCRRHFSPLEANNPPKPISVAVLDTRSVRLKVPGRSRSASAATCGSPITTNCRDQMRTR